VAFAWLLLGGVLGLAAPAAPAPTTPPAPHKAAKAGTGHASSPVATADDFDAPTPSWLEGPVRYLVTQDEAQVYRALNTTDERARAIRHFWSTRDPDPSSPENECRLLFYKRVEEAQRLFTTESTKPGWKTDRGKIYIMLGPPDEADEGMTPAMRPDDIVWTYRNPPPGSNAGPNQQVRFRLDETGEYRLRTDLRFLASETAMGQALALQAMQYKSQPPTHALPDNAAEEEPASPDGMSAHADVFQSGRDRMLAILTLWVPEALLSDASGTPGAARVEVSARIDNDGGGPSYDLAGPSALRPGAGPLGRGPNGTRIFQGGAVIRPGTYTVHYALVGSDSQILHRFDAPLAAQAPGAAALAVGPIAFAAHLERLAEPTAVEYLAPFVLGWLRVVPRAPGAFGSGDDLAFYYQVSGAQNDPIEGVPDLEVEYTFEVQVAGRLGGTAMAPLGHPIHLTHEASVLQGFSLPLGDWQPGHFRLKVTVTDNIAGTSASNDILFQVR
jgi:GWxTD domain-containing protein